MDYELEWIGNLVLQFGVNIMCYSACVFASEYSISPHEVYDYKYIVKNVQHQANNTKS